MAHSLQRLGTLPPDPVCDTFELQQFLHRASTIKFNTYLKTLTFGSSPPPLATSCLRANPGTRILIFHSKIFLSHKKTSPFENF